MRLAELSSRYLLLINNEKFIIFIYSFVSCQFDMISLERKKTGAPRPKKREARVVRNVTLLSIISTGIQMSMFSTQDIFKHS